jgi:thioredoxin-related protein
MKKIIIIFILISVSGFSFSQKPNLYNPKANGINQLDSASVIAKAENKHILIQIGGNWCTWCFIFNDFIKNDIQLDSLVKAEYVVIHINYDGKNQNAKIFERLEYPQRFGFPVLVITDASGKRIHTQNTALLEEGKSYNKEKVTDFLKSWTVKSVSPESYKK